MFCSQCGNSNDNSAKFCGSCGALLPKVAENAPTTLVEKNVLTSSGLRDFYKAAIGASNRDYYLRAFQRFKSSGGSGVSWNWPAFFITFYWLLYRKCGAMPSFIFYCLIL